MKSKFAELGLQFNAPSTLNFIPLETQARLLPMATTKASFMGARPGLLLPAPFEVPQFLKNNAQVPQSTRGTMPI
jgi:hypothetical protein